MTRAEETRRGKLEHIMALTDPYKIRLGDDLIAYLDTLADPPEYVRQAIRWARALDLTEATATELGELRALRRHAADVYADPIRALEMALGDATMEPLDALADLERAGWTRPYLCAACDSLNGTWMTPFFGAGGMRLELSDAQDLGQVAEKHGGDPDVWRGLLAALNDAGARALRTVAIEFWRGHRVVEARLGYGPEA
jgi:hypothetical protein